jgi:hypothetical protein
LDWRSVFGGRDVAHERDEQRFQLLRSRGLLAQPLCPVLFGEDGRHAIVKRADKRIGGQVMLVQLLTRSEADLDVLCPPRNKPPAHLLRNALAVFTANGHQHRIGRANVP